MNISYQFLRDNCKMIHSFGLGFIQIKLNEKERVHVYTPKLTITTHEEEIHDHRYNFTSLIVKGHLFNEIFIQTKGDTHLQVEENCSPNKDKDKKAKDPVLCGIKKINSTKMEKGTSYWMDKDTLHRVSTERCITFLTRDKVEKDLATIIYPKEHKIVCPFSANLSEKELWSIVKEEFDDVY